MSTLVHAALTIRKTARSSFTGIAALGFALLIVLGIFRGTQTVLTPEHLAVFAAWAALLTSRALSRSRLLAGHTARVDFEIGALLLVGAHAVVQTAGGLSSPLYPTVYVVVALVASFAEKPAGAWLVAAAVTLEWFVFFFSENTSDLRPLLLHTLFITSFGILNIVFTRVEIARVRDRSKRELAEEKERVREDAKLYRLVGSATETRVRDEERAFRSSVEEVHQSLYHTLDLLRRTMGGHTCALFLISDDRETMRIAEIASDSDDLAEGPFSSGEGAVGAALSRAMTMNLENIKLGYKGLCYYRNPGIVRNFLGVPLRENGQVRGVLCVDRIDAVPFSAREEHVFESAQEQVLRIIHNERVFLQLERGKNEQAILYRASQALGSALNEDAVLDAGLAAASDISIFDFAAVTLYHAKQRKHSVRRAVGEGAADLQHLIFRENNSLTAMVVQNKHYLPYRGDFDSKQHVVFTRKSNFEKMNSLLILPLIVREDAIGTLCLAAKRRDAFGADVRPTLQMLANQVAVALANAASVRRLEELATTDGLTGCLNKRSFLEELDKRLRSAERFGRKLSLIVTDIDKFKAVNDTYGHATGDVVIKELGAVLHRVKRETDVVARFGGEEFCILCEETDAEGARLLAERVREELAAISFQTEIGALRVTCSLGVATFPGDASNEKKLFEAADKALYAAKHGGRNRVCQASDKH